MLNYAETFSLTVLFVCLFSCDFVFHVQFMIITKIPPSNFTKNLLEALLVLNRQFCSWLRDLVPHPRASSSSSEDGNGHLNRIFGRLCSFIRRCIFGILSVGPLPSHIAFIMDGNRRYAKKHNLKEGDGHRIGFLSLMSMLKYCYELQIKYITVYAFSIDNFRREAEEVKILMELMQEKIEGLLKAESIVMEYGVRVHFVGNLKFLSESLQSAINQVTNASAHNTKAVLVVCVAYTSTDEITHSTQESFLQKKSEAEAEAFIEKKYCEIKLGDIERHMHMAVAPDVDILIRTSGESRLSNFLLWQTTNCMLYCPSALWPELRICHLVWSVLNFQRHHSYLEKKKKQA